MLSAPLPSTLKTSYEYSHQMRPSYYIPGIDGQGGGGGPPGCFLKVVYFGRSGKLEPKLESVGGEVPRPRMNTERQGGCFCTAASSDWKMRLANLYRSFILRLSFVPLVCSLRYSVHVSSFAQEGR